MGFHADEFCQGNIKFFLSESLSRHSQLKNPTLDRHCEINSMIPVVYLEIFENKELFRFN